jgi:undecaprenyl-diphosphatase
MSFFEALILGIVQGITEFLPLSSSGHLKIFEFFFGMRDLEQYVAFDLTCHLGTLLAIFVVLWRDIFALFHSERFKIVMIMVALIPLFPVYFLMGDLLKSFMSRPEYLGFFFLTTSALLFLGSKIRFPSPEPGTKKTHLWQSLVVGLFQTLALCPGISRSGSTISAGRMLGWDLSKAMSFSFLLVIPTILGGVTLEFYKMFSKEFTSHISFASYMIGFVASFVVGVASLTWLMRRCKAKSFNIFAWYCLVLGIFCIAFLTV